MNIDKYQWGLKTQIREYIRESRYTISRQVVDAAKGRELELKRQDREKERERVNERDTRGEKRPWESESEGYSKRGGMSRRPYYVDSRRDDSK